VAITPGLAIFGLPTTARASPTATAAILFGPGLVDVQAAVINLLAGEPGDGRLGLGVAGHLDEAESLRLAGIPVHDHRGRLHRALRHKHMLQVAVRHAVRQVAYVNLLAHTGLG
jgi:hypothetical protein